VHAFSTLEKISAPKTGAEEAEASLCQLTVLKNFSKGRKGVHKVGKGRRTKKKEIKSTIKEARAKKKGRSAVQLEERKGSAA
jgi:hypothetical protein